VDNVIQTHQENACQEANGSNETEGNGRGLPLRQEEIKLKDDVFAPKRLDILDPGRDDEHEQNDEEKQPDRSHKASPPFPESLDFLESNKRPV
jgi:hypothetical protein